MTAKSPDVDIPVTDSRKLSHFYNIVDAFEPWVGVCVIELKVRQDRPWDGLKALKECCLTRDRGVENPICLDPEDGRPHGTRQNGDKWMRDVWDRN